MAIKNITEITRHLMLCNGGTCTQKGAEESTAKIRAYLQDEGIDIAVHTTKTYCNGRCQDGPVVIVMPEGTWYKQITADKARKFVQQHLVRGQEVSDWVLYHYGDDVLHPVQP